ncbi:MAG: AraC family transcriptional regulator [Cyanobacteria bacterium P01_B01_bin.77]
MTIKIKIDEFDEQFQEVDDEQLQWDASDELDNTYKFDARFSQGWRRSIQLRDGICLEIDRHQPIDHLFLKDSGEEVDEILCAFTLSGKGQWIVPSALSETLLSRAAGKYTLWSNGLWPQSIIDESNIDPYCHLFIIICPSILRSFASSPEGELPANLQHLIKTPSKEVYRRCGDITPMMTAVLQHILNCPYKGMVKRAYLESKVIELIALVLDHEIAIQQGEVKKASLKPEQIERIHYARELILQNLSKPLSVAELSRQIGLNEFLLKQGFHQVFNTSPWKMGREERLAAAKRLLAEQDISITEAAYKVGYANLGSFSEAFKEQFKISPKKYQKKWR